MLSEMESAEASSMRSAIECSGQITVAAFPTLPGLAPTGIAEPPQPLSSVGGSADEEDPPESIPHLCTATIDLVIARMGKRSTAAA